MRRFVMTAALVTLAAPALAQERPEGWRTRFDRPNANPAELEFVSMAPGWHITTGPAGIFYHPDSTATGRFRLEAEIFLFPTNGRDREAFGVFFGGRDLEGAGQAYSYFLIRNTGSYLVKRRAGAGTSDVVGWTDAPSMARQAGEDQAKNVFAVEAGAETVEFYLNGARLRSVPRSDLDVDGIVGLRVNHGLNLHVSSLTVRPSGGG